MRVLQAMLSRFEIVGEIFGFLWRRKLWWIMPMIAVLFAFGLLLVFAQSTGIAPFIYTLF